MKYSSYRIDYEFDPGEFVLYDSEKRKNLKGAYYIRRKTLNRWGRILFYPGRLELKNHKRELHLKHDQYL